MIKIMLKTGLLALVLLLASKAYIALTAYQSIAELKDAHQQSFLLTYEWISSDLNGTLSIEGIELTPYVLKRTFYIDRLDITFSNYSSLMTSLSDIFAGNFSAVKSMAIPQLRSELKGRSLQQWIAAEYKDLWLRPFGIYGCGDTPYLSAEQMKAMGMTELQGSMQVEFAQTENLQDQITLAVDLKELGRFTLRTQWLDNSFHQALIQQSLETLSLSAVNLNHQEAGFFRRLNVICNPSETKERKIFSIHTANAWKQAMDKHGLSINQSVLEAYFEYLLKGGEMTLDSAFSKPFSLSAYRTLLDQELFDYFNATLDLNGRQIEKPALFVDRRIVDPPPVVTVELEKVSDTPKAVSGYRQVATEQVGEYIGHKIRVLMIDQKHYEGLLTGVTEYNLDLTQNLPGGRVNYPLMLNEIETVEIWFNAETQAEPLER